jgi:hypothetical protein
MRLRGINYDTGSAPFGDTLSRVSFEPAQVRREIAIIARDLHCNAIRITGRDAKRMLLAAEHALAEGLEVWFSPFPCNMTAPDLMPYFEASARAAESLRAAPGSVVFVLGCELTIFNSGFIPGDTTLERMARLVDPAGAEGSTFEALVARFQAFLDRGVGAVRDRFAGPVTYAAGPWEPVDWAGFDFVSVDHYRDGANRSTYREQLRPYFQHGKPVVVTELGCCAYRGAPDRGALGWTIVDRTARPPRLKERVVRDENVQADHLTEMLSLLDEERVEGAFWFTFAGYNYPYHEDPSLDLDRASHGLVKVMEGGAHGTTYPDLPWEPKRAFAAMAARYARS